MKNVELIPLSEEYLEDVLVWRNAPEVRNNMYTRHEISKEEHLHWFSKLAGDESRCYFVCLINNIPCGIIGFSEIHKVKGIATWAFYTSIDAPIGVGSLMEYAALQYAFNVLNLHKLRCEVLGFNKTVVKLHQKFGFSIEGCIRSSHLDDEGHYHDVIHLGIFDSEWAQQEPLMKKKLGLGNKE